jgi:molecular chaperone GrpE
MENTTEKDLTNNNDLENAVAPENEMQNEQHNSADSAENSHEGSKNGNSENPEELLKQELALANDKYIRLYSEFDNFRRRTAKEKIDLMNNGAADFFKMMLPVVDDFERALKSINDASDVDALKQGVDLIYTKFKNTLTAKGLKEMESKEQPFDADLHEAITQIPAPTADLKGKVVDELEKGYYLNDKVIRYAKVVVGN